MTTETAVEKPKLARKDFLSSIDPRWCPGCGDYAILKNLTSVYAEMGVPREKFTVISGIGCSSRLPYYAETYGFHTIHGRAPTVALGAKLANPDLNVWVITGDGDALSIGGNHFMHTIRRNPDIKIVLFNNQIYGLTKGQASPTSPPGLKTKTTPFGAIDTPVRPSMLAIASGATFSARVLDTDGTMMKEVMTAAARHRGTAVIEVLVNCVIFNDGIFDLYTNKETAADNVVKLKHGEPLIFGKNSDKALVMDGVSPKVVGINDSGISAERFIRHDASFESSSFSYMLASMDHPEFPLPVGILRQVSKPTYEDAMLSQEVGITSKRKRPTLDEVLTAGDTWTVG